MTDAAIHEICSTAIVVALFLMCGLASRGGRRE